MSFKELGLSEKVQAAVEASGYTEPTPIQAQAIPHALTGRDILGIAQTGTGKTAAFTLPMLSRLETGRARARMPRTLILEPTRELAAQVEESFVKYGVNHKLNVALLIGGVAFGDQETKIMRGADVLIATPGRLLDFHERGKLLLTGIEILVIDEADRMLDMGFIPDIEKICKLVPFTRQTLFFSATMPPEITRLTEQFLQNPVRIEVARVGTTAATINQIFVATHGGGAKREMLRKQLREQPDFRNAIIFCNRKRDVAILHKSLTKHGFSAGALHGDMDQPARMASLDAFKRGDVALLVCSDVAARGLDIPDVSHVFNFDVPIHPTITCTASAAPVARASRASRSRSSPRKTASTSRRSRSSSSLMCNGKARSSTNWAKRPSKNAATVATASVQAVAASAADVGAMPVEAAKAAANVVRVVTRPSLRTPPRPTLSRRSMATRRPPGPAAPSAPLARSVLNGPSGLNARSVLPAGACARGGSA